MPSFSISNNALLPLKAILRNLYTLFIKACYVLDTSLNSPLAPILTKKMNSLTLLLWYNSRTLYCPPFIALGLSKSIREQNLSCPCKFLETTLLLLIKTQVYDLMCLLSLACGCGSFFLLQIDLVKFILPSISASIQESRCLAPL